MDLVRETVLSGWGIAGAVALALALAAVWLLRGRTRLVAAGALALGTAALFYVAASDAHPRLVAEGIRSAGEALLVQARAALRAGDSAAAAAKLEEADARFRTLNPRDGIGRVELARGDLARFEGRLGDARTRYLSAAARLSLVGHPDAGWARLRAGLMEQAQEDNEAARKSYEQAAAVFAKAGLPAGEAEARLAFGALARQAGSYAEAVQNLRDAARLFGDDRRGRGRAILELAWVSQSLRHNDEALALVAEAEALFAEGEARFGLVLTPFVEAEMAIEDEFGVVAFHAIDRAEAVLDGFSDPVAAAATFLGLPPVGANLARFAQSQAEARALVARARYLIERGRNQADAVQQ